MDDPLSGPPSTEAEAQREETVMPLIWIALGALVVMGFIAILVAVGQPAKSHGHVAVPIATPR